MLRDDERRSQPLRPGRRAELPSLRGNIFWHQLVETHQPYSGSRVRRQTAADIYYRMTDLQAWADESTFCSRCGLTVIDSPFSQFNADPKRAKRGIGVSACTFLRARDGVSFLLGQTNTANQQELAVLFYDASGKSNGGTHMHREFMDRAAELALPLIICEGDPQNALAEIDTEEKLALCLVHLQKELSQTRPGMRTAIGIVAPKVGSSGTGNTMGIDVLASHQSAEVHFTDHHGRRDHDGEALGMVQASIKGDTVDSALGSLAHWIWTWHIEKAGCTAPLEVVGAVIDWEAKACQDIQNSLVWRTVQAFSPLLPEMVPGDFPIKRSKDFGGEPLLQLCSTGMKMNPIQQNMWKTFAHFGGSTMAQQTGKAVAWMLSAFSQVDPGEKSWKEAMTAHGDIAHKCGPTMWLKQLGIMSESPPYPNAPPLRIPTETTYFLTLEPTHLLDRLHSALRDFDLVITNAAKYVETQKNLIKIFADILIDVGQGYQAPQLAKKLVFDWAEGCLNYDFVTIRELREMSADAKQGLAAFTDAMPGSVLTGVLKVLPPLAPMWYCLIQGVTETPQWIEEHVEQLREALRGFIEKFSFPPRPTQLITMALGVERSCKKRSAPGWVVVLKNVHARLLVGSPGEEEAMQDEPGHEDEDAEAAPGMHDASGQENGDAEAAPANDAAGEHEGQAKAVNRDVGLATRGLYAELQSWRQKVEEAVKADDLEAAAECRVEVQVVKGNLSELQVCSICWIEEPSAAAMKELSLERWYGKKKHNVCAYCGVGALPETLDRQLVEQAETSLRLRAWTELRMAIELLPGSCTKKLAKELHAHEMDFRKRLGQGKGVRVLGKRPPLAALVSQLHRTRERLALEPRLHSHCAALGLALSGLRMN